MALDKERYCKLLECDEQKLQELIKVLDARLELFFDEYIESQYLAERSDDEAGSGHILPSIKSKAG